MHKRNLERLAIEIGIRKRFRLQVPYQLIDSFNRLLRIVYGC